MFHDYIHHMHWKSVVWMRHAPIEYSADCFAFSFLVHYWWKQHSGSGSDASWRINLINLSFVSIIVPPQISVNNTTITVEEGDRVVIQCSATGIPVSNVTWFNNRQEILGYGKGNASLFFKNITRNEQGTYVCIAKNSAGKKEKESNVNVVCKY